MSNDFGMRPIAHIHTCYHEKFGVPRQSGLIDSPATVVFGPEYSDPESFRGIEEFSHLWLIWLFSGNSPGTWSPTVRPPRLGGNRRVGVFASRSPFRPNPIGMSCVRLDAVEHTAQHGTVLHVSGADMTDNTPILDIKPYIPYADSIPGAKGGYAAERPGAVLKVSDPDGVLEDIPESGRRIIVSVIELDPRPAYHSDPGRVYGMTLAGYDIHFRVDGDEATIISVS